MAEAEIKSTHSAEKGRLPFDAEFMQLVEMFCSTAMMSVPELDGIAIIPIWANQPEKFPPGLLHLRDAQPPYLATLLKLLQRLAFFSVDAHKDMLNQLRAVDQYAGELSEQIQNNLAQLQQQNETADTKSE